MNELNGQPDSKRPKVSICMVTYNHGKYIRQAIESALAQKTDFDYELVIGEDCSTDGTREIVAEFQSRYPERIRATLYPTNMGAYFNGTQTLLACRGAEYIAFLDGDDYWTSADKLQKQVDYLDRHPDCSLCFHTAFMERDGEIIEHQRKLVTRKNGQYTFDDIVLENFIDVTTVLFRSFVLCNYPPKWLKNMPMGDWPLWILCAQKGNLGYIDENLATYRIHSGGTWTGQSEVLRAQNMIKALNVFRKAFRIQSRKFEEITAKSKQHLIELWLQQGEYFKAAHVTWSLLPYAVRHSKTLSLFSFKILLRGYLPPVWQLLNQIKHRRRQT